MDALVIFDMVDRNMILTRNDQREKSFPIGQLFIELLEVDFNFYEEVYINSELTKLYDYFDPTIAYTNPGQVRDENELNVLIDAHNRYFWGKEHPYFEYANMFSPIYKKSPSFSEKLGPHGLLANTSQIEDIASIFENFWDRMKSIQENMKRALEVCLDVEYQECTFKNMPLLRYWEGQGKGLFNLPREYFHAEVEFFPKEFSAESYFTNSRSNSTGSKRIKKQELLKMADLEVMGIVASNPFSVAFAEFSKMIDLKIWVKKCDNCGHYFLLGDNKNRKYCDQKRKGFSSPCNEIGAYLKERAKRNNPVHKARTDADNRVNGLKNRGHDVNVKTLRTEINKHENDAILGIISEDEAINKLNAIGRVERKSKAKR